METIKTAFLPVAIAMALGVGCMSGVDEGTSSDSLSEVDPYTVDYASLYDPIPWLAKKDNCGGGACYATIERGEDFESTTTYANGYAQPERYLTIEGTGFKPNTEYVPWVCQATCSSDDASNITCYECGRNAHFPDYIQPGGGWYRSDNNGNFRAYMPYSWFAPLPTEIRVQDYLGTLDQRNKRWILAAPALKLELH